MKSIQTLSTLLLVTSMAILGACSSGTDGISSPVTVGSSTGTTGGSGVLPLPPIGSNSGSGSGPGSGGGTISNSLPVALADVAVVQVGSTANPVDVLLNDRDANGDNLIITAVNLFYSLPLSSGGTTAIAPDGKSLRYTPPAGFVGTQALRYFISDGQGGVASALAVITVSPMAVPPAALPDVFTKLVNASDSMLDVLANDVDGAGGGLAVSAASSLAAVPAGNPGTVSVVGGALHYQPAAGFVGVETLSYTLTDTNGATATAIAVITVLPLAAPPVALPDVVSLAIAANGDIDVLANDVDLADGGLTLTAVSVIGSVPLGSEGSFAIANNRITYTPASPSFIGTQTASYSVTDQNGSTASGLLTLVVTPIAVAVPPLAVADLITLSSGSTTANLNVLGNDIDVAGGGLTITASSLLLGLPDSAGVTLTTDGSALQLALPSTYAGVLTLSYTITDINGGVSTTAVIVTVAPAALPTVPPVAVPDLATVLQDSSATLMDVLANDIDPAAGGLTLTSASTLLSLPIATHTIAIVGNQLQFTPAAGFAGVVTLSYTVTDIHGATGTGLLTLTVSPIAPIPLPLALNDLGLLQVLSILGTTGNFDVLSNDIDPAGGGLTLQSVNFQNPLLATVGSVLGMVGNQVQLTVPLLGLLAGVLPIEYTAVDSLGRTVTGVLNVTLFP